VRWIFANPRRIWLSAGLVLVLLCAFAASPFGTLRFDANPRTLEPPNSTAGRALRLITEKFPGFGDQLLVLLESNGPQKTHDDWTQLQAAWTPLVQQHKLQGVSILASALVLSPANVDANMTLLSQAVDLKASRRALDQVLAENGAQPMPAANALLDALSAIAQGDRTRLDWRKQIPSNSAWWFLVDQYFGNDPNITAGYVRPAEKITSLAQKERLSALLAQSTAGIPFHVSGWTYTLQDLVHWARGKMIELSLLMIGFNAILLTFLYRRFFPMFLLMLSMTLSIGALLASLKLLGVPLNLFNVLAFPLVLGIGVDYGIYMVVAVRGGGDFQRSVASIVKPIFLSGLTTTAGFASLALAQNPALQGLGIVCSLGVAWCLLATFFFILPLYVWRSAR
jgi:predicted RND superfamily exporter protein